MNEFENCLQQIERTEAQLAQATLDNVRAKYERSLKVWTERAAAAERTQVGRAARPR